MVPSEAYGVLGLASGVLVCTNLIQEVGMSSVAYLRQLMKFLCLVAMRAALKVAKQALKS